MTNFPAFIDNSVFNLLKRSLDFGKSMLIKLVVKFLIWMKLNMEYWGQIEVRIDILSNLFENNYLSWPGHPSAGKPEFSDSDPRHKMALTSLDPRIHFALNCGASSCPPIRIYTEDRLLKVKMYKMLHILLKLI